MSRALQDLYPPLVLEHGRRPRNRRVPERHDHRACGANPLCGDHITVYLRVVDGMLGDVAFGGEACAIANASASLMTVALTGLDLDAAWRLHMAFLDSTRNGNAASDCDLGMLSVLAAIGAAGSRELCATLAWEAVGTALAQAQDAAITPIPCEVPCNQDPPVC